MHSLTGWLMSLLEATMVAKASPTTQEAFLPAVNPGTSRYYDIQAHRGGRGNTVENTLPAFAWALIDGATTLELDNGISKDGEVIVWHDESILGSKCKDTTPAFHNDPDFPYVGKFVANLTLAQIKTLDCGSQRQAAFPMQVTYANTRISTLGEVFDFVECADPAHQVLWNIESKINAHYPNRTRSVSDYVQKQHAIFAASAYRHAITYQSFDWRTLVEMKRLDPNIVTSALIDEETAFMPDNSTSPWLAGRRLDDFAGPVDVQVARAAADISADVLSPAATFWGQDPTVPVSALIPFTTELMVREAHQLGIRVKPWTVNQLDIVERLVAWDVDGIITDYPNVVRRWARVQGMSVAPKYPKQRVLSCLERAQAA